jgi:hypothetical protein
MKKPVLGVDADDVVWKFNEAYVAYHNHLHGTHFKYEDIYTFDMVKMYGLPLEIILHNIHTLITEEHHSIVPFPGAIAAFTQLATVYDLQIITSRHELIRDITVAAFDKHAPKLFSAFHFTNSYSQAGVSAKRTKLAVCREIGAVALVEDAPINIFEVARGGIPVYMLKHRWNQLEHHPELEHKLVTPFSHHSELPKLLRFE